MPGEFASDDGSDVANLAPLLDNADAEASLREAAVQRAIDRGVNAELARSLYG